LLAYNLLRLLLLAACLGIGWLVGVRGVILIVAALAASGVLSWFLLARQRIRMGIAVERAVELGRVKMAARTAAEDEYAESIAQRAATDQRPS